MYSTSPSVLFVVYISHPSLSSILPLFFLPLSPLLSLPTLPSPPPTHTPLSSPSPHSPSSQALCNYGVGKVVYIRGTAPVSGDFWILMVPEAPQDLVLFDISLCFRPNFSTWKVERTTFDSARCTGCSCLDEDGRPDSYSNSTCGVDCNPWWGEEDNGGFPFTSGAQFSVAIVAQLNSFEVIVDGVHFASYNYRVPISDVMTVLVSGVPFIERIEYY